MLLLLAGSYIIAVFIGWVIYYCCYYWLGHILLLLILAGSYIIAVNIGWVIYNCCFYWLGHILLLLLLAGSYNIVSGRVLDSRQRGRGFEHHRRHCVVVLEQGIYPSLGLVQPRNTCPCLTERLLMGRKESNQTNILLLLLLAGSYIIAVIIGWVIYNCCYYWLGHIFLLLLILAGSYIIAVNIGWVICNCCYYWLGHILLLLLLAGSHNIVGGRVLDSRQKGRGFEHHQRHCIVVLKQDTFILA